MSTIGLVAVAVARDEGRPTRTDLGRVGITANVFGGAAPDKNSPASIFDMLTAMLPTGLVTAYTAFVTAAIAAIEAPTADNPAPDQLWTQRWFGAIVFIVAVAGLTWATYVQQSTPTPKRRVPLLEILGAEVIAIGWVLGSPGTPLEQYMTQDGAGKAWSVLIAFVAFAISAIIAVRLKMPVANEQTANQAV